MSNQPEPPFEWEDSSDGWGGYYTMKLFPGYLLQLVRLDGIWRWHLGSFGRELGLVSDEEAKELTINHIKQTLQGVIDRL